MLNSESDEMADDERSGTERICLTCRKLGSVDAMLRFICSGEGVIEFDIASRYGGRGAWVCANRQCLEKAINGRLFSRTFKKQTKCSDNLASNVVVFLRNKVLSSLGLALKAGQCVVGQTKVVEIAKNDVVYALILAHDLSEKVAKDVERRVKQLQEEVIVCIGPSKQAVGDALGRGETGVIALRGCNISHRIVTELRKLASLELFQNVDDLLLAQAGPQLSSCKSGNITKR